MAGDTCGRDTLGVPEPLASGLPHYKQRPQSKPEKKDQGGSLARGERTTWKCIPSSVHQLQRPPGIPASLGVRLPSEGDGEERTGSSLRTRQV